jgi:hypothetical protein
MPKFDRVFEAEGIAVTRLRPRAPNLSACA